MSLPSSRPQPGADLTVPAGPGLRAGLVIPASELSERFSRSSGPGGQGVNTTDSRVELIFRPATSSAVTALPEPTRRRLLSGLAARMNGEEVAIAASEHRSQRRNRAAARERLVSLLREAAAPPPPPRRATRPTLGSKRRRLAGKKQRGQTKARRGPVTGED
ncbi:MAG: aminoacyl-tRNA hydrolase [Actinomycetota bacterium]|nr:aminoacyl-tRNA hydrolase [Actinomycetota bacterium]